jgi:hypothetical protein
MNITISGVKARARLLMAHMRESGKEMSLTQALEALSASENNTDWNRYQAFIKSARLLPQAPSPQTSHSPHKIFASGPGFGSGPIAEAVFAHGTTTGSIPVIVMLREHEFPSNKQHDTTGWLTINVTYNNMGGTNLSGLISLGNIKGVIIRPCFIDLPGRDPEREAKAERENSHLFTANNARLTALSLILNDMAHWLPDLKKLIGTIILYGMEVIDQFKNKIHSRTIPHFMKSMRAHGGNQNLFLVTSSDLMKEDILNSNDEYKLIISESTPGSLFSNCPIDKLMIEQNKAIVLSRFDKLFKNEHRVIEDISIYIGALSIPLILKDAPEDNSDFDFIRTYTQGMVGSSNDRSIHEGKSSKSDLIAFGMISLALKANQFIGEQETIRESDIPSIIDLPILYAMSKAPKVPQEYRQKINEYLNRLPFYESTTASTGNLAEESIRAHEMLTMQLPLLLPALKKHFNIIR